MTTIAVAWDRDTICIAADSLTASDGYTYPARLGKLMQSGDTVLAFCGPRSTMQLLRNDMSWVPSKPKEMKQLGTRVKQIIHDAELVQFKDGAVEFGSWGLLVSFGKVYQFESDFVVHELSGPSHAIGSGAQFARGAMYATRIAGKRNLWIRPPPTPTDIARLGVEAACANDTRSGKPVKSITIKRR